MGAAEQTPAECWTTTAGQKENNLRFLPLFNMRFGKCGAAVKKGETHQISGALITSTLLPCVLDGFSGARSGGSALSIPPTNSMFSLSFVTAGLVLLTFCLLMQIERYGPFFSSHCKLIVDRWALLWTFLCVVTPYRSRAPFSWDPEHERMQMVKTRREDWLLSASHLLRRFTG